MATIKSIEEKAKRYDEIIIKAKEMYARFKDTKQGDVLEDIFPELKESEGDKIRRALIEGIAILGKDEECFNGVTVRQILAWFEKQGNKDEEILILKDQIESLHAAIIALKEVHKIELEKQGEKGTNGNNREIPNSEQKPDTDFSDLKTWKYIVDAVWTEKEGIGQYLDSPFTEEVAKKLQKRFGNIEQNLANSAKISKDEQKPADKVKPKFHEGDWVTIKQ